MRFGIYSELQCSPAQSATDVFKQAMTLAEHADNAGLEFYGTVEHHFYPRFSICADPLALYSAIAQRTSRINFRTMCHVVSLHNALALAGQIAQADVLCGGRLECGVGRGHGWRFLPGEATDLPMEETQSRYEEGVEILMKAWQNGSMSYEGKHYQCTDLNVVPKPIQATIPMYTAGTGTTQLDRAARLGWGLIQGGPVSTSMFLPNIQKYRGLCDKHGTAPNVCYVKAIYVDEDADQALEKAQEAAVNFLEFNFGENCRWPTKDGTARLHESGYGAYAKAHPELGDVDWTYERAIEERLLFVGTPEQVADDLIGLYEETGGYHELAIVSQFGGLDLDRSIRTQTLFANRIRPILEEQLKGRSSL